MHGAPFHLFAESHPSCRVIRIAGKSLTTSLIAPQALHDSRNFATVFGMLITSLRRSTRLSRICGLTNVAALSRQIQPQLFVLPRRKLLPRITTVCGVAGATAEPDCVSTLDRFWPFHSGYDSKPTENLPRKIKSAEAPVGLSNSGRRFAAQATTASHIPGGQVRDLRQRRASACGTSTRRANTRGLT